MENLFAQMREHVLAALGEIVPDLPADAAARVEVTPARDPAHGDMATNAALIAAKPARLPPPKLAAALVEALRAMPGDRGARNRRGRASSISACAATRCARSSRSSCARARRTARRGSAQGCA